MKEYMTEQRKKLLDFFVSHADMVFSMDRIEKEVDGISRSAIYRNINRLIEDGILRRIQKEHCREFFYQYISNMDCNNHFHLKCDRCGGIYHLRTETTQTMVDLISSSDHFELEPKKTTLFGCCKNCK